MNDRCSCHHQQQHERQTFEDRCRVSENELKQKTDMSDKLRNEIVLPNRQNDLSRSTCISTEQSLKFVRNTSQRSNSSLLIKNREIAKLKALIFGKDNELIALKLANKNALTQMEEQMERERKVWNEHKELLLVGERTKFEEEKFRSFKDLQDQLKLEQERCQRLEQKLYDAQMASSEAQLMLKDSGRERINAVYGTKEQCRKEFQDEITRLRNQFQSEKNAELARLQERIRQLEDALDHASTENADVTLRQHELFLNLETYEKTCVRSINDCIKKLLMAMDSPSHVYAKIPHMTSLTYDRESIIKRLPTRHVLQSLQDTVDDVKNYIVEQKVQIEARTKFSSKSKVLTDRTTDYSNRTYDNDSNSNRNCYQQSKRNSFSQDQKENDHCFHDIDRLPQPYDNDHHRLQNNYNSFHLSSEQNDTINNLVQKLEDHIASELNRLTKQRLILNGSSSHDSTSFHLGSPTKIKFESDSVNNNSETKQGTLIRHLQDRIGDLRDDSMRLCDHQQLKSFLTTNNKSTYHEDGNHQSFSPKRLYNCPTT
ncbi:unnamed protein product [Rotaria sordida]|uniref:Uncharacterized protein n=1 Tax=Rotaria sordida TaxID=392033 RepID=A0A813V4J1_9BILA|nr:unnamed protein product [Rotaria sordida]CAF3529239.1 unnamed protein product [Rotaria sordida]